MGSLISKLSQITGLLEKDVRQISLSAPLRYKTYPIKKRNGDERIISQPSREVKTLQRLMIKNFLSDLPIHPAVMAYEPGTSIRKNADRHSPNGPILKLDFKEFFPSIRISDWISFSNDHSLFEDDYDRLIAGRILFHKPRGSTVLRLAIGAPSSPHLSNLLMYSFDRIVSEKVSKEFVTYTRYADDLTFSATRTGYLQPVEKIVRQTLREIPYPRLHLNEEKRVFATNKYRRSVTGLILTNDNKISIGRDRKRLIRSMTHHLIEGKLDPKMKNRLHGLLAFVADVEPEFLLRLELKFGREIIQGLLHASSSLDSQGPDS